MTLSEKIRRRASAHSKGTALHREMMAWAKEAEALERAAALISSPAPNAAMKLTPPGFPGATAHRPGTR